MAAARPRELGGRWLRAGLVLLGAVLFIALLRRLDAAQVGAALGQARLRWVALAATLNLAISMPLCGLRWRLLLAQLPTAGRPKSTAETVRLYFARCALNILLLPPAGDVLFALRLRSRGYSTVAVVALQFLETVLEMLSMGTLALLLLLLTHPPVGLQVPLYTIFGLAAAGATLLFLIAPRLRRPPSDAPAAPTLRGRLLQLLGRSADALAVARAPRIFVPSLAISLLHQLTTVSMIGLCLNAVAIHLPPSAWFLVCLAATFVGLLPSTPGQLGVLEAGLVVALGVLGVGPSAALAFSLLYHAANVIPVALVGLLCLPRKIAPTAPPTRAQAFT